ncbi:MAG: hypothetical protein R6U84_01905 [Candidatus Cloacimonadales bacterium]
MKKIFSLLFLTFAIVLVAEPIFQRGVGVSASLMSGAGISYRQVLEDDGYQITAGFFNNSKSFWKNAGASYIKPIHQINETRLNLIVGGSLFSNLDKDKHKSSGGFGLGLGPEVEFSKFYNIRLVIGAPFTLAYFNQDQETIISITPSCSFFYYFQ